MLQGIRMARPTVVSCSQNGKLVCFALQYYCFVYYLHVSRSQRAFKMSLFSRFVRHSIEKASHKHKRRTRTKIRARARTRTSAHVSILYTQTYTYSNIHILCRVFFEFILRIFKTWYKCGMWSKEWTQFRHQALLCIWCDKHDIGWPKMLHFMANYKIYISTKLLIQRKVKKTGKTSLMNWKVLIDRIEISNATFNGLAFNINWKLNTAIQLHFEFVAYDSIQMRNWPFQAMMVYSTDLST